MSHNEYLHNRHTWQGILSVPTCSLNKWRRRKDDKEWRRSHHREPQETYPDQRPQPAAHPSRGSGPRLLGEGMGDVPTCFGFIVPPDYRAQGHLSSHGVLHSHGPLRAARQAPGKPCFARMVRQDDQRGYQGFGTGSGLPRRSMWSCSALIRRPRPRRYEPSSSGCASTTSSYSGWASVTKLHP